MRAANMRLAIAVILLLTFGFIGGAQGQGTQDPKVLAALYTNLSFPNVYPIPEGPVAIGGQTRTIKIGFSQTGFNHPWRIAMIDSARAEVARHPNVQMIVTDGKVDVVKQSSDIDDLLAQGVDAIVMSPVEDAGLRAAARKVMAAKKPLIVLDRDVSVDKTLFMGQSNLTIAAGVARAMVDYLTKKHGKPMGTYVEVEGLLGSTVAVDRHDGFTAVIKNYPDIKLLATGDGGFIREPASKLMDDWLVRFSKIDAVYSHAEESGWGAEVAIDRAGRINDHIAHFTIDASNEGMCAVKAGMFIADGNYTPYIGHVGVRAALHALMGKELTGKKSYQYGFKYELPDTPAVTKANVNQWLGNGWGDWDRGKCGQFRVP